MGVALTGKEMVRLYKKHGWELDHKEGSHYIMRNGHKTECIPVHSNTDLAKGLQNKLLKRLREDN